MKIFFITAFLLLLCACNKHSKRYQPNDIVIAQCYRSLPEYDTVINTFSLPKLILFRNDTIYCYRYSRAKYSNLSYEYGQCLGALPEKIQEQLNYIAPTHFDTIYPHNADNGIYDGYHYALADLKSNRYCLFMPRNVKDSSFQVIQQLLNYTDTVHLVKINDVDEINNIKETILKMVERHNPPTTDTFFQKTIIR